MNDIIDQLDFVLNLDSVSYSCKSCGQWIIIRSSLLFKFWVCCWPIVISVKSMETPIDANSRKSCRNAVLSTSQQCSQTGWIAWTNFSQKVWTFVLLFLNWSMTYTVHSSEWVSEWVAHCSIKVNFKAKIKKLGNSHIWNSILSCGVWLLFLFWPKN